MLKRKYMITAFMALCLTVTVFVGATTSTTSSSVYDPWVDLNDDGSIDSTDLGILGVHWSSSGTPTNKTALLLWLIERVDALETRVDELEARIEALEQLPPEEMKVGALLPLTGDLATFGENERVAAEFAVEEVNTFLKAAGANWSLSLVVEDTVTNPSLALEKLESLAARGIELIVGPLSCGEVRAIKGYCDANKILAISPSCTAPDLAIADDYIFRFCPTDKLGQGPAIGRIMYDDGTRYVIPVTRNDAWGKGLQDATEDKFVDELEGTFLPGILYDPEATTFPTEASDLATKVSNAIAAYGADNVSILHISFEEATAFMTACTTYDVLDDIKWYGSDGTCTSGAMLEDTTVRDFAMSVEYPCTIFAPTHSDKWETVRQHCVDTLGREPDAYAYVVYDIVWVYALSLLEVDAYDSETVKAVLPTVTQNYSGASGLIELDEFGDRKAGDLDIWKITEVSLGTYDWRIVGRYILATDSVVWY